MSTHLSTVEINSEHDFNNIEDPRKDSLLWGVEWLCTHHAKFASKEVLYAGLPKATSLSQKWHCACLTRWEYRPVGLSAI